MNTEMDELYSERTSKAGPDAGAEISRVLAVDPAEIVSSVLALSGLTSDDPGIAVGHAGLRRLGPGRGEVRKVMVDPSARGLGVSKLLMIEIEEIAREHGLTDLVLQTGNLQIAAMALYEGLGYTRIPVYGGYEVIPGAVCYGKVLESY